MRGCGNHLNCHQLVQMVYCHDGDLNSSTISRSLDVVHVHFVKLKGLFIAKLDVYFSRYNLWMVFKGFEIFMIIALGLRMKRPLHNKNAWLYIIFFQRIYVCVYIYLFIYWSFNWYNIWSQHLVALIYLRNNSLSNSGKIGSLLKPSSHLVAPRVIWSSFKEYMPHLVTSLHWTPIFEWYVDRCGIPKRILKRHLLKLW